MMFLLIGLFIGLLLITFGLIVHLGKKYDLIAGYNTMDEPEKSAFNIKMYARHFGIVFYIMGTVLVLYSMVIELFDLTKDYFVYIMLVVILPGVGYLQVMGWIIKKQSRS